MILVVIVKIIYLSFSACSSARALKERAVLQPIIARPNNATTS
jgi:hypothetical protein